MAGDGVAWIVAVEKYAGAELNLRQPVGLWALEFAELMVSRGVQKVVLSTSLGDNAAYAQRLQALEAKGVVRTGAEIGDIKNALGMVKGQGTLWLYWVGHGIMAPSRQLLCADSQKSELSGVSADSLLKRLRSAEYPPLQMGFFECCAQVVVNAPAVLDLGGDGKTARRQFFYHAASAGEIATASTEKAGFSSTVLNALSLLQALPLDPVPFFDGLKAALGSIPLQTRPFLERTEESGDKWSSGDPHQSDELYEAAQVAELTQSQFDRLWQIVAAAGVQPVELGRAIRDNKLSEFAADLHAAKPQSSAPDLVEKAGRQLRLQRRFEPLCLRLRLLLRDWEAVYRQIASDGMTESLDRLEDLPQMMLSVLDKSPEYGLPSFVKFLLLGGRRAGRENADAQKLREAIQNDPELGRFYAEVNAGLPLEKERLYLLLAVVWEPNTQVASLLRAWVYPGVHCEFEPRQISGEGKLAEQINRVVQQVLAEFPERSLLIELLSPKEMLSAPRELLEVVREEFDTRTWLEGRYAITVRWHERMKANEKEKEKERYDFGAWMAKSSQALLSVGNAESLSCVWRPTDKYGERSHVMGLSIPGPCPEQPLRNGAAFFGELLKGVPYMCWPRNPLTDGESFRKAATALFAGSGLSNLPEALRDAREDPWLCDLVVMIDEPRRNPYTGIDPMVETRQRGADS